MANQDFGTGKSLVVLAIVVGCFAILWPKIFYPMMQTAFAMTSPKVDDNFRETDRPPHLHPGSMNPRSRKNSISNDIEDKFHMREGRPFPHPQARQPIKSQPKSGGAMSIIMPIYTVGIIVFFLYTVLKLVFKKPENEKKPLIKDFHMDPQYRKFMCDPVAEKNVKNDSKSKKQSKLVDHTEEKNGSYGLDAKDCEIYKLKKKLEETEEAMDRIKKHMDAMSACLSGMDKQFPQNENSDVRLRNKTKSKHHNGKSKKSDIISDIDQLSESKRKKLKDDLAKAILIAAQISEETPYEKETNNVGDNKDENNSGCEHTESEEIGNSATDSSDNEEVDQIPKENYYTNGCCNSTYECTEKAQ